VADGSRIAFEVVVRSVRHRGSWRVQVLEALLLKSPSARPEYDTPPFAVVMTAADTGTKLTEFPAQSHDAAMSTLRRLERETAETPTLDALFDRYSIPNGLRPSER